jgi:hypothetical protein
MASAKNEARPVEAEARVGFWTLRAPLPSEAWNRPTPLPSKAFRASVARSRKDQKG